MRVAGFVHAGDERTHEADVGGAQLAAPDVDERAAREHQVERLSALRGRDGSVTQRGVDGIDRHQDAPARGQQWRDEVGEDATQLHAGAVGAHVHLGGDVERQAAVDVLLLQQQVLVEDLLLVRAGVGELVGIVEVVAVQHRVDAALLGVLRLHEEVEHVGPARLHVVDAQADLERCPVLVAERALLQQRTDALRRRPDPRGSGTSGCW